MSMTGKSYREVVEPLQFLGFVRVADLPNRIHIETQRAR
jgi:hypothetical protein